MASDAEGASPSVMAAAAEGEEEGRQFEYRGRDLSGVSNQGWQEDVNAGRLLFRALQLHQVVPEVVQAASLRAKTLPVNLNVMYGDGGGDTRNHVMAGNPYPPAMACVAPSPLLCSCSSPHSHPHPS